MSFLLFFVLGVSQISLCQKPIDCNKQLVIVRLYINKPKLDFLKSSLSQSTNDKDRSYFERAIQKHTKDRLLYAQNVIRHYKQNYVPSHQLRFIPDSLWQDFVENVEQPYFLNDSAQIDNVAIIPNALDYYIIARGNYDEDFIALQKDGQVIPTPFPSKIKHSILSKINTVLGDGMRTTVERYCKQINKYCMEH